jgi:hypothetical protein
MKFRYIAATGGLFAILGLVSIPVPVAPAAKEAKPAISEEASAALLRMGQALSASSSRFRRGRSASTQTQAASRFTSFIH